MIRPFTLITMLLAASSGAYLFAVKHRAQVLDDRLAATAQNSRLDAQRIRVLQAQWALEIDPSRLGQLAAQFTTLTPMQPAQLMTMAALQAQLPPAGSAGPGGNPADDAPVLPPDAGAGTGAGAGASADGLVAMAAPALPLPPDVAPAINAAAPARLAAFTPPPAHLRAAGHIAARYVQMPRPLQEAQLPMGARLMSVKAMSAPATDGADTGSALGMASAALPPPQPLADGSGN